MMVALLQKALTPMCDNTRTAGDNPGHGLLGPLGPEVCVRGLKAGFQGPGQKQSPGRSSVL